MILLACTHYAGTLHAQLPFYTDDTEVTPRKTVHFEFFNETDALQSAQFPSLRQKFDTAPGMVRRRVLRVE